MIFWRFRKRHFLFESLDLDYTDTKLFGTNWLVFNLQVNLCENLCLLIVYLNLSND